MRRGGIRRAVLASLLEGPAHGYEVMRRLEQRSGGMWRPSPGSVYPTLQMLEDEGLVRSEAAEGTRTFVLTDSGRAEAESAAKGGGRGPWEGRWGKGEQVRPLIEEMKQFGMAVRQVLHAGSPDQVTRATAIISGARRDLYHLLAEEQPAERPDTQGQPGSGAGPTEG